MEVRFWGTRGSIPASLTAETVWEKVRHALEIAREKKLDAGTDIEAFMEEELPFWGKATYGTNTPCLEIRDGERFILCDAGTGLRDFGNEYMRTYGPTSPGDFHIFMTHFHWDHIQGFPFFVPAYIKGTRITFYSCHEELKKALTLQQEPPFFPVRLKDLPAEVHFMDLDPDERYEIEGFEVLAKKQNHPGLSYGYRVERNGRSIVYSRMLSTSSKQMKRSALLSGFLIERICSSLTPSILFSTLSQPRRTLGIPIAIRVLNGQ